jgi:dimethylglycine dehydrogenase
VARCVGAITSGAFGYAVSAWLGWAYVEPQLAAPGTELEVLTLGQSRRAEVLGEAAFVPGNERPRS